MGLIKAAASAISSTFHDQWKDFINCEDLGNDTLMVKKTTENGVISKEIVYMTADEERDLYISQANINQDSKGNILDD